jgi:hypothetical protein
VTQFAPPPLIDFPRLIGQSALVGIAFGGEDLTQPTQDLIARMRAAPDDAGVLMDLATLLMCQGGEMAAQGLALQMQAIHLQPTYVVRHGTGKGPRILALMVGGDFMANTPVDFLLDGSDATLILHFVDAMPPHPGEVPDHDAAFLAIAESPVNARVLGAIGPALAQWPRPVLNNSPSLLAQLTRAHASQMLTGLPGVMAPLVHAVSRGALTDLAHCQSRPEALGRGLAWPLLIRPIGAHGGQGLVRLTDQMDLLRWLAEPQAASIASVYLMSFVDYQGPQGLYAKYRVAMIGGKPFASHMALSPHWMVHYLNADMDIYEDRRMEEAVWMAGFEMVFARRHAVALGAIQQRLGLDYYALDCAEAADGRLLIFEVDTAMIIHNMDDPVLYPYKGPVMQRLCTGFLQAFAQALPSDPPERGRFAA